jgi:subtilase family protein
MRALATASIFRLTASTTLLLVAMSSCTGVHHRVRPEEYPAPQRPPADAPADVTKLEPPLRDYLERIGPKDLVPVVLILDRQLTDAEKAKLVAQIDARDRLQAKRQRRAALISELKRVARTEQARLLPLLNLWQQQGEVSRVRPLWLSNVIGLEAPRAVLLRLTAERAIRTIHLDLPRPVKGANAWGVDKIQADDVWPTGYNGAGVTVAVLDTGVRYTHGDLANRMWINAAEDNGDNQFTAADNDGVDDDFNGFIDDVVGWNFSGAGSNDPNDFDGHGTHVAGTIAGDGTGGTQTGVAPGARIMALRESNTIVLSTQMECWAGMQYALDNGADVVSFSSGWLDIWSPAYATWRNNVKNLMDAGVLFVTIAHNDSSATGTPNNVRTPGRVPVALTVGATDSADVIAGFSNQGPVTWQTVAPFFDYPWPPGLRKPDVAAPGVAVNSTIIPSGYGNMNGTSMAAPHASGLAALLLDEDPALTPYDLKLIIEETAVDLGAAGPDNVYGWGRINALAAVNYSLDPTPYDLAVTGTTSVWSNSDIWVDNNDDGTPDTPVALTNNHLYARIRNLGGQAVSDVEVKFYYADVGTIGISGFDPNGDGDPADGNFNYIGSYRVPTLGPAGSNHATVVAAINWNIPVPTGDHWCVGIGIVAPNPPNATEGTTSNNAGFRNFFDIITSTAGFDFKLYPPPAAPEQPFMVEILKRNLADDVEVELVIDAALEPLIARGADGLERLADPLFDTVGKALGREYYDVLGKEVRRVRYRLEGERIVLPEVRSPRGAPLPVKVIFRVPDTPGLPQPQPCNCRFERPLADTDRLLIVNAIDRRGKVVGGLTIRLNHH